MSRTLSRRGIPLLVTTVLTAAAAVLVTWPLARRMGGAAMRTGEVLLTAWQLNWYQHALLTEPLRWIDANIFFPYENAATFNDLLLTHALVTLPAAWTDSPTLALNLALLGGIVLCAVFAHLLIVEVLDTPWAAAVGGTLFALAPFRFLHLGHLSIAAAWAVPLFFWALLRHLRDPSWARAGVACASGVAVALSSLYHAAYVAPIVPLLLLFGARRGPRGRQVWLPLLVGAVPCLALLAWMLAPFAATLQTFGVAAAPHDLLRYGADLSSLGQKPDFLGGGGSDAGINAEAHLYPGTGLFLLAAVGVAIAAAPLRTLRGWRRSAAVTFLGLGAAAILGVVVQPHGPFRTAWELAVLVLVWIGPVAATAWAVAATRPGHVTGSAAAIRLGVAGVTLSFVLALGPQARYANEVIGPAPYGLLTQMSSAFEGTRVPARFGGIVLLFLALAAAGALGTAAGAKAKAGRLAGLVAAGLALVACLVELPVPRLPRGHQLVSLPELHDPAYAWIRDRPGRFGILELPDWPPGGGEDYEYRGWRSLRYMLASKQHGRHLVNGTGRVEPFLWKRFQTLAPWSDSFFGFIAAYFPVDYVLVHDAGIPVRARDAVLARLEGGGDGWRQVFRSTEIRVFAIDRSFGRGTYFDRLFLRRDLAPTAGVVFAARATPEAGSAIDSGAQPSAMLDLSCDGELIGTWQIDAEWRQFEATVPIAPAAPENLADWPQAGVLLRWTLRGDAGTAFEIANLWAARRPEGE